MNSPYPYRPGEADCRDYLRTGRCKYGESCKYNHSVNVESGGGTKPLNPSEPPFPIRQGEPPCQYFLKHGTCKFGQACKFNHPGGSSLANAAGSSLAAGQLVYVTANSVPGDAASHLMAASSSVQVLPQRPTEPNCIYFLRNGKCKYGATCKFHHPLDAVNRNNQAQHHVPSTNTRQYQNTRDWSQSAGSSSDARSQIPQGVAYATAANVTYVQSQRLQPITERVRPQQQPTHVLLPDGQIAVILDQQSLKNVNEMHSQDRPKYYLSQTEGSIGTLPSMDPNNNSVSPMLTATTTSTSSHTFDSSIDLMGTNVVTSWQGQMQGAQSRGPHKSSSGGSLSAYGSLDSGSNNVHGDFVPQASGQVHSQQLPSNLGQAPLPQYAAWPANEGPDQSNRARAGRSSASSADSHDRQRHVVSNLERNAENTPAYYWPSNGSFSSIPVNDGYVPGGHHRTVSNPSTSNPNISNPSTPNPNLYGSSDAIGQAIHPAHCAHRRSSISLPVSSEQMRGRHEHARQPPESSGNDEGFTMMTSALLTMMDRHAGPPGDDGGGARRIPGGASPASGSRDADRRGRTDLRDSLRPPPGIAAPPGAPHVDSPYYSSSVDRRRTSARSSSPPGGGYFVGGYDRAPSGSPPWGG